MTNWWEEYASKVEDIVQKGIEKAAGTSADDSVWWDNVMTAPAGQGLSEHTKGVQQPTRLGAESQQTKVYSYFADPAKRVQFATDLYKIGAMNDSRGFTQIGYFAGASAQALAMYKAESPNMPFTQWLATKAAASDRAVPGVDDGSGGGGSGGGGGYSGPTWSVDLTNEFDARALVDNALNNWLGRSATEKEREKFWKQLNKKQQANPNVATPVGVAGGVRSGGFNSEVFAEDFAKSRNDYAEATFATTAMDLIKDSIMGDQTEGLM